MNEQQNAKAAPKRRVFSHLTMRFIVGLIAIALANIVVQVADQRLTSISASYHTDAQDLFVGSLFVIGAFLLAYHGHSTTQCWASKIAAVAAVLVALFPTKMVSAPTTCVMVVHVASAITLFSILAYFCYPRRWLTSSESSTGLRRLL